MTTLTQPTEKKRITFIDLAKGICILLVVIYHTEAIPNNKALDMLRMPLYFILSGLFFKTYGSMLALCVKKANKLLIPFIFFNILGCIKIFIAITFFPDYCSISNFYEYVFSGQLGNPPSWFLLCLFWCNFVFCSIYLVFKNKYLRLTAVLICGVLGYYCGQNKISLPMFFATSLSVMPFFYVGYILKQTPILYANKMDKFNWLWVLLLSLISAYCIYLQPQEQNFLSNDLHGGVTAYIGSTTLVVTLLILCKMIKSLPVISYIGRYSIITLLTHIFFTGGYRQLLKATFGEDLIGISWYVTILTVLSCLIAVPICIRLIPWFVAQKDILPDSIFQKKDIKGTSH